eukprot:9466734-Pyramimonas_sp.AAC.2
MGGLGLWAPRGYRANSTQNRRARQHTLKLRSTRVSRMDISTQKVVNAKVTNLQVFALQYDAPKLLPRHVESTPGRGFLSERHLSRTPQRNSRHARQTPVNDGGT